MVFLEKKILIPRLLVKNAKNNFSEDIWFWSIMFYHIKIQANTNWSSHRKKHQTFDFFSNDRFLHNFQKTQISEIFGKHQ